VKPRWTDVRSEKWIGLLLRSGVILAALVVLAGGAAYLRVSGWQPLVAQDKSFHSEPAALRSISGIVGRAFDGDARGVIQLGLLLLIATPVARVALSVVTFALERDWMYVGVTLLVLALLVFSLTGGHF
jgi:uncharacterized membrane protein